MVQFHVGVGLHSEEGVILINFKSGVLKTWYSKVPICFLDKVKGLTTGDKQIPFY